MTINQVMHQGRHLSIRYADEQELSTDIQKYHNHDILYLVS